MVLLREQRGRHQHGHLPAGLDGRESGAHRDLGLAEADVAADDAVHRLVGIEVGQHLLDRVGLVGGFLEREGVGERAILELAQRQLQALARLALGVEVEQLGGHVAHLLGGAAACLRPLVGAELVQRRGFRGRAGVAADQLQRVHRHVEPVAVAVLEHQELATLVADVHDLQADVAADAVFLVHHGRAGGQGLQVAQDGGRVGGRALASPAFLAGPGAEQLRLRQHRDRRLGDRQAGEFGGDREREAVLHGEEGLPAVAGRDALPGGAQHLGEHLAAAGRIGREQHPAGELLQEGLERRQGTLGASVEAEVARRRGREVRDAPGLGGLGLEVRDLDAREALDAAQHVGGLDEQLHRVQQRPLDVVAAVLVARADRFPVAGQRAGELGGVGDHRIGRQVVEQRRGLVVEQRQVELDARRRDAVADAAIERAARRVAVEARAPATAERAHRVAVERDFARRQQSNALQRVPGALGLRIEAPDRLDLVVEKVDPQR